MQYEITYDDGEKEVVDENTLNMLDTKGVKFEAKAVSAPAKPSSTYAYSSPDDYEMLKRNLGEVGYSGLDETQKGLFKSQFANSKFARAGGKFEDAVKYVDESAGINPANQNAGNAWSVARMGLSIPVAAIGGYLGGLDKYQVDPTTGLAVEKMPGSTYLERVNASQNEILGEAKDNKGIYGTLANPSNVLGFGLGKGAIATGEKVFPSMLKGLGQGAAENTGLSVVDQYQNEGRVDPFATGVAGLTGGIIGAGARPFRVQQGRYDAHAAEQKLANEDPLSFVFGRQEAPQGQAISKKMNNLVDEADPSGLYTQYQYALERGKGAKLDIGEQAALIKSAKKAIAENSSFNRKISTITDREAREYLEGIVGRVDNIRMGSETGLTDLAINAPKPLTKTISDAAKSPEAAIATGLTAGVPGLLTRHVINRLPSIADKSDRLISKLSTSNIASGVGNALITNTTSATGKK